jgi:SAM-dependent methyltransferase
VTPTERSPARILRAHVADLPIDLDAGLAEHLARVLDVEGKIPRALEALGPIGGRDVILVDGPAGIRARQLAELGARVTLVTSSGPARFDAPEASADAMVACWSAFRGAPEDELAEAQRLLRPGGRLLVVHDYGRDDVAILRGELPEHGTWSRRGGPFLRHGFKIRVVHCFWTFTDLDETRIFLDRVFGPASAALSDRLTRPRLSYNVAVYHRTFGED